ncbi:AMP-dependent synthetase and ligase [Rhizorhabdus wittichii RW1]|uniref:AMP-dependent synthetase and ligase n=1 Tax=Rhizorhabdus wittichii (strain DSM 6014 / CCUG 31198 / JCM 15750 / NBRC 105917 / EY 4224 / RW1) TaxID=392499 RepID=A0A9J9HF87_RHIWR|nr:AMP-dependent synthetase and ligase [Rhizorhabdus wittichii RW1]
MRIIDIFDRAAGQFADRACLIEGESSRSYVEVRADSCALAAWIAPRLDRPGSRIAVLAPNGADAIVAILAIFRLGALWIPANAKMPADDIGAFLATTRCDLLLAHPDLGEAAERAAGIAGCAVAILSDPGNLRPSPAPPGEWRMDDICTLFATGGTTGSPKAAMWSHRTWASLFANFHAGIRHEGHAVHLAAAPITHAAGVVAICMFAIGATTVIIDRAEPSLVMASIERHRVTTLFLPPTAIYTMLAHPEARRHDFSSLQNLIYAAAPMSVGKLREAMELFGPVMVQTFGQAEAPMLCTILTREDHADAVARGDEARLASCGRPALLTQVMIVDDAGRPLPAGETGEIAVKGDLLMAGYFENPEASAACRIGEGWQRTGDVGFIDDAGFVSITDRKRDMIITGGFNVFPSEIEQVLWSHDAVQDCAVIGCPDEKWGEAVLGVVELKPGRACGAEELIALCRQHLGSIRTPKRIDFWPELPRSPVGKVLKREIRDHYWGRETRRI